MEHYDNEFDLDKLNLGSKSVEIIILRDVVRNWTSKKKLEELRRMGKVETDVCLAGSTKSVDELGVLLSLVEMQIAVKREAMIEAVYEGDVSFIKRVAKANPQLLWDNGIARQVFEVAIEFREPEVFTLIYGLPNKVAIASHFDANNSTLLHKAAALPHPTVLHQIQGGPALQMQTELQWFKEVESIVSPAVREWENKENSKPYTLFTHSHKDLVVEGEKWLKETSSSFTIMATLIATLTFATTFLVFGGSNKKNDSQLFLESKYSKAFVISNVIALSSSITSLLMFLGILTSRFADEDFLKSLPTLLMMGLLTLFFSIEAMIVAFSVGLYIIFHQQSWIIIPIICLMHIPVAVFVRRRLRLLIHCFIFAHGASIFDRNVKPWK